MALSQIVNFTNTCKSVQEKNLFAAFRAHLCQRINNEVFLKRMLYRFKTFLLTVKSTMKIYK